MADLQANVKQLKVKLEKMKLMMTKPRMQINWMKRQREILKTIYKAIDNLNTTSYWAEDRRRQDSVQYYERKFTKEIEVKLKQLDHDIAMLAAHTKEIGKQIWGRPDSEKANISGTVESRTVGIWEGRARMKHQNDHSATKVTKTQVKLLKLVLTKVNGKLKHFWSGSGFCGPSNFYQIFVLERNDWTKGSVGEQGIASHVWGVWACEKLT